MCISWLLWEIFMLPPFNPVSLTFKWIGKVVAVDTAYSIPQPSFVLLGRLGQLSWKKLPAARSTAIAANSALRLEDLEAPPFITILACVQTLRLRINFVTLNKGPKSHPTLSGAFFWVKEHSTQHPLSPAVKNTDNNLNASEPIPEKNRACKGCHKAKCKCEFTEKSKTRCIMWQEGGMGAWCEASPKEEEYWSR